jgi:uncharacterized tellurite resistance protein B-like protein
MIDAIRKFMAKPAAPATVPVPAAQRDIAARLPGVHVAAAALLLELAHADGEFSAQEQAHIHQALGRHFGLDHATATELLALADAERRESVDHFQFTRIVKEQYDVAQRVLLAEVMWGVILADGEIANHEAYLIRKMANLLELEPAFLSQARKAAGGTSTGG